MQNGIRRYLGRLAVTLWGAAVIAGFGWLLWYSGIPGAQGAPPAVDPIQIDSRQANRAPRLMLFAHPHCPCTRASLKEFADVVEHSPVELDVRVIFIVPENVPESWARTATWTAAHEIARAKVQLDPGGELTRQFGANTSGQVLLYDNEGTLRFSGGVTELRAHEGDSPGKDAIFAILEGRRAETVDTLVFGCPLEIPGEQRSKENLPCPK